MLCVALSLFNNQDGIINQQADQPGKNSIFNFPVQL